jgi:hypothetical protein
MDLVLKLVKETDGVKKINNYVRLKSDFTGAANKTKTGTTDMDGNIEESPIEAEPLEQNY